MSNGSKDRGVASGNIKIEWWRSIWLPIILAVLGPSLTFIFTDLSYRKEIEKLNSPEVKQGFDTIKLEGTWKYICIAKDGSYRHGGRFFVIKNSAGELELNGERMWKDERNMDSSWRRNNFANFLQWKTEYIYVRKGTQMIFEYRIDGPTGLTPGYCTGTINAFNKGKLMEVKGKFFTLFNNDLLSGDITFSRIDETEYNNPDFRAYRNY